MSEHDPLCPCYYKDTQMLPRWEERCQCDLIAEADARARADEREKLGEKLVSLWEYWDSLGKRRPTLGDVLHEVGCTERELRIK